jgi:AcrR family transcriptional regulator
MKVLVKKLGRPCAVDSGETRKLLVREARRSFAAVGYDATTNRALAEAAGITTGAIYHYFPSKLDMYVAAYSEMQEVVQTTFEGAAAKHETFAEKFSAILDSIAVMSAKDPTLAGFVVGVASELQRHPELSAAIAPLRLGLGQFLSKMCSDAVDRGEITEGINALVLQDLINVVLTGLSRFSTTVSDQQRGLDVIAGLKQIVVGAARHPVAK